ncbi:CD302 antigen isoform X2 [Pelodiscus sinensis]|uniref:CD302 antigen isoform X2 n=1 Tax=Pelodiscus sinensis TaxID=13735 RepID=UPI003F6B087F
MVGPPFPALFGLLAAAASSASGAAECPSSAWIPFGSNCYIFLQGTLKELNNIDDARDLCKGNASGADIISIKNKEENTFIQEIFKKHWQGTDDISLGMFFDTDDNAFKWFDKSEMKFTNWIEEESNEELLNTCASMYTKSGQWRKISCEDLPLTGTLCKTAFAYEKKYLPAKQALSTARIKQCGKLDEEQQHCDFNTEMVETEEKQPDEWGFHSNDFQRLLELEGTSRGQ